MEEGKALGWEREGGQPLWAWRGTACLLPSEVRMAGPPFAGEKVDSETGKGLAQVGSARLWCRSATSRASDVLPNVLNSHLPTCPTSLTACSVPRLCGCDPHTSLPGGYDRTEPPGCAASNTGPQPGPQRRGPAGHRGLRLLPGRHAGLDRCLSARWVGPCTSTLPQKSFLKSNLIPAHCSQHPLGTGIPCV